MCNDDLKWLSAVGFEVGSHSHTHQLCGTFSDEQFQEEARFSKQIIENIIGCSVVSFSYPYGRQRAYSKSTAMILRQTGFKVSFTQEELFVDALNDLYFIPRINVHRYDTEQSFRRKLLGYYELLSKVRKYVLQIFNKRYHTNL